jgi:hypothetical protein
MVGMEDKKMLKSLEHLNKYRIKENPATVMSINMVGTYLGSFIIGAPGLTDEKFKIIASIDGGKWEHISLGASHIKGRLPRLKEIEQLKNLFFEAAEADDIVMDTARRNCWHLWRNRNNPQVGPPVSKYNRFVWLEHLITEDNKQKSEKIKSSI